MHSYELTIVLPGKASANKKSKATKLIEEIVKTFSGKITKSEEWGNINLAYPIDKNDIGLFLYFEVELEPQYAKQLDGKLRLEEDVIRHLFIKK